MCMWCVCVFINSGLFAAGDKVTYNGTELLCHSCVVAASGAPERPTHISPVQSVAVRPQGIPVGDRLHSPDSDFSTSGKRCRCRHIPIVITRATSSRKRNVTVCRCPSVRPSVCSTFFSNLTIARGAYST